MKKNLLFLLALGLVASLSMTACSSDDDKKIDNNGTEQNGTDNNGTDNNGTDNNGTDNNGTDNNVTTDLNASNVLPF